MFQAPILPNLQPCCRWTKGAPGRPAACPGSENSSTAVVRPAVLTRNQAKSDPPPLKAHPNPTCRNLPWKVYTDAENTQRCFHDLYQGVNDRTQRCPLSGGHGAISGLSECFLLHLTREPGAPLPYADTAARTQDMLTPCRVNLGWALVGRRVGAGR